MIITDKGAEKKLSNNILTLAQAAKEAKDKDKDVINATIGMLADENNQFYTFKAVKEVMKDIDNYHTFAYSDTDGGLEFQKAISEWMFGPFLEKIHEHHYTTVVSTPGGSGTIGCTFQNYLEPLDKVLLPSAMWETYITFAKERDASYLAYDLFDLEGNFNIASLKEKIDEIKDQQKRIVIVINDPCENPTGFCMKDKDYDKLVSLINSYENYSFVLLMDVAYFDYYSSDGSIVRNRYLKLLNINTNALLVFSFSGSKTFGLYGLRIGAGMAISKVKEEVEAFHNAVEYSSRSNWSSCSTLGNSIITRLVLDSKYNEMFKSELKMVSAMLGKRAETFLKEAKKVALPMLPFERGFFLCVPTKDPVRLMNELHKSKVYVVVTKNCIRIAICSISEKEAERLPKIIKQTMRGLGE